MKFFFAGDQHGGIAGATRGELAGDFAASDFFGSVNDFEDGEAAAVADVEGLTGDFFDGFECAEMGIGDVENVNVVSDAGAVGSGIVGTKNLDMRNDADGGVEDFGNEMGFDAMGFAAFGRGAGGVEIPKRSVVEAGIGAIVGKDLFKAQFGFAVRVDGIFGVIFWDGNGVRFAVGGGGGGEDEFFDAVAGYGVEEIDAGSDVRGVESAGLTNGLCNEGFACEVHHCIDLVFGEDFLDWSAYAEIDFAESRIGGNGGGMAFLKIVEGDDLVAMCQKNL